MDSVANASKGFTSRQELIAGSKSLWLFGRPHLDLAFQERLILNWVDIKIKFIRSKNDSMWWVMGKSWLKMCLYLWEKGKWYLPFNWDISKRRMSGRQNIQSGVSRPKCFLLRRVIWLWVKKIAWGRGKLNQIWIHSTFNISIWISWHCIGTDNRCRVNIWNLTLEWAVCYTSLFTGTGMMHSHQGNCIPRVDFGGGFTRFVSDMTSDLSHGDHSHLLKTGSLHLEINFKRPLPSTINIIVYAEY